MSDEKELQTITAADVGYLPPEPPAAAYEPILQYFSYGHLPPPLRTVSAQFSVLAEFIVDHLPRCAERTVALRKLLEGKDAAVRAALGK